MSSELSTHGIHALTPSRVSQDDSRVDEPSSSCPRRPQSAGSVSRSEGSQNNDTPGTQNTQSTLSNGTGQLASLANKTLPSSSAANATPQQATQNSTTTTNSTPTTGIVSESQAKKATPLSPPLSPQTQATPLSPRTGYFAQQPAASGNEPRSPATRRPPASRSSHGIETASGPPPALSTQRSYPTEPHWKQLSPTDLGLTRPSVPRAQTTNGIDFIVRLSQDKTDEKTNLGPVRAGSRGRRTSRGAEDEDEEMLHSKRSTLEDDQDRTLRSLEGRTPSRTKQSRYGREEEQLQSSHEDLFLNLAHTDAGNTAEPLSRFERRRSQAGLPSPRQPHPSRPSSSGRLVSSGKSFADQDNTPSPDIGSPRRFQTGNGLYADSLTAPKASPSKGRSYAASAHPLEQGTRYRYTESNPKAAFSTKRTRDQPNRETSPEPQAPYLPRESMPEASSTNPSRSYKYSSNGQYKPSPHNGRSSTAEQNPVIQTPRAEGTESSASTTAPSTVWDELDDMKSRIRKLELTGKLPQSSGAAMSNIFGDRPPTATTTVTTVSSSPKNRRDKTVSPEASTVRGRGTDHIHPLLHSALARSKFLLDPNMYRALEATAADALTLAAMTGSTGGRARGTDSPASAVGTANAVDRQLRRKADSMCRSLTELCIALADDKAEAGPPTTKARPGSRDATAADQRSSVAPEEPRFLRASTQEPEARSSSRIMSRLEARRSSLQAFTTATHRQSSPMDASSPTQKATPPVNNNRLDRNSSALLHRRPAEEEEQTPPPVSSRLNRTSSVLLHPRQIPQNSPVTNDSTPLRSTSCIRAEPSHLHPKRTSREYTSQYPLPVPSTQQQRSPSVHSALPSRRTYFQASTQVPVTPVVQPGSRRYLEQRQTPPSNESPRLQEARERRRALFEQHAGRRIEGSEVGVGSRN